MGKSRHVQLKEIISLSISGQSHGLQPVLLFTCTLCWGTDCIWCIVCCRCGCRKQRLRLQQTAGTLTRNGNEQRRRKRTTLPPSRRKPSPVHQPKSRCHNLQTLSWLDLLSPPNHEKCSVVLSLTCITLNYLICCIQQRNLMTQTDGKLEFLLFCCKIA